MATAQFRGDLERATGEVCVMSGSKTEVRGACPEIGQAQLMEIADNLLREVAGLRLENSKLKDEVKALAAKATEGELWEEWSADDDEDSAEFFDIFTHAVRQHEKMLAWRILDVEHKHNMAQRARARKVWQYSSHLDGGSWRWAEV